MSIAVDCATFLLLTKAGAVKALADAKKRADATAVNFIVYKLGGLCYAL